VVNARKEELIPRGCFLEQLEDETKGNHLTQIHMDNGRYRADGGDFCRGCQV